MNDDQTTQNFRDRYGEWAVITGASDGTGASFARRLASLGLNLLLIARRQAPLKELAREMEQAHGVEVHIASIDLYGADASDRVIQAAEGLPVGLFISNAGSDTNGAAFLKAPFQAWEDLMQRNIAALVKPAYTFAEAMVARGRGGIIVMSSGAALGGQPGGAVYSATKAFGLNFAESLWSELSPQGIDVLCAICGAMDTPSLQQLLDQRGLKVPGLLEPDAVVEALLSRLGKMPLYITPFMGNDEQAARDQQARIQRLAAMEEMAKLFYGETREH